MRPTCSRCARRGRAHFEGGEVHFVSVEGEEEVILTETWRNTGGFVVALL
ncbi:MAG: hypothetical protein H6732_16550 [Alphaproteobacteria bacterium]|nr:hypothetical protein [Alphaproteobacteria bacterium]